MKKDKLTNILTGLFIVVLGFLVAIFGAAAVLNLYFGIAACIAGAYLLGLSVVLIYRRTFVQPSIVIGGAALVGVGIGLLFNQINAGVLISLLVFTVLGGGAGLIIYGIYLISKKGARLGIIDIISGTVSLVLAILYLNVNQFAQAFWIIVGVLIAGYGVYQIVNASLKK